jgi:arabinogalactan endo-1,4-beta-galactosidase
VKSARNWIAFSTLAFTATLAQAQQPPELVDIRPNDGEVYYLINQLSGLQAEGSHADSGSRVSQQPPSFSSLSQRWALARAAGAPGDIRWEIQNAATGSCLIEEAQRIVLRGCHAGFADQWELLPASNGYYAIRNLATRHLLSLAVQTQAAETWLAPTAAAESPAQSELWLPRPVFFRGVDNALLEKQEALRVSQNTPWWKDGGQPQDVLSIFRNHGINLIRLRPSSSPPYVDPSVTGCEGNACYAETDAQNLDLAKRAKNLGMSVELSLLFDGGNSQSIPPAWASDTFEELQADLYAYVKAEIESYRRAGVMPDLVAIGNEVDTGFLGSLGSPTGAAFGNFATLQKIALQAVQDAAGDAALGSPIPRPLTCIHITPAWNLTSFFTLANQNGIAYDVICQSYYPFFHGPLTESQAAAANPFDQPVEQDVLVNAANQIGKPIFLIETGEHYENGFDANDPWYPPSMAEQRQFLLDVTNVVKTLPDSLGMGVEYWNAAGVNILANGGPFYFNGGFPPESIYVWNGLTLFDNADTSGSSNPSDLSYSELLPGMDALGNKLDQTLEYKFATPHEGLIAVAPAITGTSHRLLLEPDSAAISVSQQWVIQSNDDGFFQVRSKASNTTALVLDGRNTEDTVAAPADRSPAQEWNVSSLGNGLFEFVNRLSGEPLSLQGHELRLTITPTLH